MTYSRDVPPIVFGIGFGWAGNALLVSHDYVSAVVGVITVVVGVFLEVRRTKKENRSPI